MPIIPRRYRCPCPVAPYVSPADFIALANTLRAAGRRMHALIHFSTFATGAKSMRAGIGLAVTHC